MIELVRGELLKITPSYAVIDVGGVALKVWIPLTVYEALSGVGSKVELVTYLHVREDILQLYGFLGEEDRTLFERMLSVSGVGPKLALMILSRFTPAELTDVVTAGDSKRLSTVKGIGQKTAQRLIIEFRGKVDFADSDVTAAPSAKKSLYSGVVRALEALGYSTTEADDAARDAIAKLGLDTPLEDIIKTALKG